MLFFINNTTYTNKLVEALQIFVTIVLGFFSSRLAKKVTLIENSISMCLSNGIKHT